MSDPDLSKLSRQELFDHIKSKYGTTNNFILTEMQKLGFWPKDKGMPNQITELIKKESELSKEYTELIKEKNKHENQEKILKDIHKKRMANAKLKREETKLNRERIKKEKSEQWKLAQSKNITYLGQDVSYKLNENKSDSNKLQSAGLPVFHRAEDLAKAMNIKMGELRFLSFNRNVNACHHYIRFNLPKKSGGQRLISAPMPRLKNAQYWILHSILNKVKVSKESHGFKPNHSIVTNAKPHTGEDMVINIDLKDFFPTISYIRTKGVFKNFGYSDQIATILALMCTEPDGEWVELDTKKYFVSNKKRHLPQGAPTSPMLTNIICRKLDKRIAGLANKFGFNFTRYADDMTFSTSGNNTEYFKKLLWGIKKIIKDENFNLHPDKTRIMRKGSRQEVTGIVVNEKLNINKKELKKFKALIFQIEKDGVNGKFWNNSPNLLASIKGYASHINQVNPEKGKPLVERVNKILKDHNFKHNKKYLPKPKVDRNPNNPDNAAINSQQDKSITQRILNWFKKIF